VSAPLAFPVAFAVLRRDDGAEWVVPLHAPRPFGFGRSVDEVAADLEAGLQSQVLDDEDSSRLADLLTFGVESARVCELPVVLPAGDVPGTAGAVSVRLHAFCSRARRGVVVEVPALEARAWGADEPAALAAAREVSTASLRALAREGLAPILAAGWFTAASVEVRTLRLASDSPLRAAARQRAAAQALVDLVASPLPAARAHHLEGARRDLRAAIRSRTRRAVVVVGPSGCGKTTLIADEAAGPDPELGTGVVTTTADRLIQALAPQWQPALLQVCGALDQLGRWLHVADLADLFDTGRYVGNAQSVGEVLRLPLVQGKLRLIAECSPERYAALAVRYPGLLDLFTRVDLPAPTEATEERVVAAWCRERPGIDLSAGLAAALWYRRFLPAVGAPGGALRFLGSLEADGARVDLAAVRDRFCAETGLSPAVIDPRAPLGDGDLRSRFASALFGQPAAVDALVDAAAAIKVDVARRGRPIATLLFGGPTGVGKTEAARVLATVLFGAPDRMVRLDLSEFSTEAAAHRLVASELLDGRGRLTSAVEHQPFCVLLLDELEKAHPHAFDLLLQVLDEGRLTDGRGRTVSLCGCVVVMTTNVGARDTTRPRTGLGRAAPDPARELGAALLRTFRPEFVNRIDRVVPFLPLEPAAVRRVLDRELGALAAAPALTRSATRLEVTEAARAHLAARGWDPARGARPLQRAIRDALVAPLAVLVDQDPDRVGRVVEVDAGQDGLVVRERSAGTARRVREDLPPSSAARRERVRNLLEGEPWAALRLRVEDPRAALVAQARTGAAGEGAAEWLAARDLLRAGAALDRSVTDHVAAWLQGASSAEAWEVELQALDRQVTTLALGLHDCLHPEHRLACLGVYTPDPDLLAEAARWADAFQGQCGELGIESVGRRELWCVEGAEAKETPPRAPPPSPEHRRVGFELWLSGPAAALALHDLAGPWRAETQGRERGRVLLSGSHPPGETLGAALVPVSAPASDAPWDRFRPSRPASLLRGVPPAEAGERRWPPAASPLERRLAAVSARYLDDGLWSAPQFWVSP
jgi:MoxR-like ATPase